ncbi:MAG: hypothetical protein NC418_07945 [Muribaculaceae bacterium]|nr:hypothetical protein [Muribaculaceae bacterium]
MIVQELFKSLSFDEIAAALQRTHFRDVENFIGRSAEYKMAYDRFCHIEPDGDGGEVTFDIASPEDIENPEVKALVANNVEGQCWEKILQKELIRPADQNVTDAEMAGAVLWGATFYGFTPHSMDRCFDLCFNDDSPFATQAYRLSIQEMLPYIKDKEERRELRKLSKGNPDGVPCSFETLEYLRERRKHLNRSKRKREYRMSKRQEELWKMHRLYHDVERLRKFGTIEEAGFKESLIKQIYQAKSVNDVILESFAYGKIDRVEYLKELLDKYAYEMKGPGNSDSKLTIIIWSSESYPLNSGERKQLFELLMRFFALPASSMQIVFGETKAENPEIQIQFISIKDE